MQGCRVKNGDQNGKSIQIIQGVNIKLTRGCVFFVNANIAVADKIKVAAITPCRLSSNGLVAFIKR